MANPRQRNKARSSKTTRPSLNSKRRTRQALRKPPPLKGPDALQRKWDKHKTVFQNYAALGLLPSIPLPGGASSSRSARVQLPQPAEAAEQGVTVGFGRIVRDEQGNVVDIILDETEAEPATGGEGDVGGEEEDEEMGSLRVEAKTQLVKDLESIAATAAPVKRHTSSSERTWLATLVKRHGDDYELMARDKDNVWQKTQGELKRMVKKAGGVDKLRALA